MLGIEPFARLIIEKFPSRIQNAIVFAKHNRMILISSSNGVDIDISLAMPGYEEEMFSRKVGYELEPGKLIYLCSAEDLIIHKLVAGRPLDITDVQGIIYRQGKKLDCDYIRLWLKEFSAILGDDEVLQNFEKAWSEV